jgi:23S rRNA (uridine2552-2'-O)-methyltransferase
MPERGRGRGDRLLRTRVRTAARRTVSSTRWLERQLNDPFVARARREGYRSRSAYKLIEIDDRFQLLRPGSRVVDLGAAPGGWTQVAVARTRSTDRDPLVIGIDLLDIDPLPGAVFLKMDFLDPAAPEAIRAALRGHKPDVVLSDLAAATTGHKKTDQLRTGNLTEAAAEFAAEVLAPGGHFVAKAFQGGVDATLLATLKRQFTVVRHVKPKASRPESVELYLVATGFRGG